MHILKIGEWMMNPKQTQSSLMLANLLFSIIVDLNSAKPAKNFIYINTIALVKH